MYYTKLINTALIEEICTPVLEQLIADEFRSGFSSSILNHMRDAINNATDDAVDGDQAKYFWSAACCGDMRESLGWTPEFLELYKRAKEEEKKPGAFVMPSWGTSGT